MMRLMMAAILGVTLAGSLAMAQTSQAPDWKQTLGGLLNGNQDRDDALRQAYERGYQRGREDEARLMQRNRGHYDRGSNYR